MKGQNPDAQAERLRAGCCPVHGLRMTQITAWSDGDDSWCYVGCPRKDCDIAAKSRTPLAECFEPVQAKSLLEDDSMVKLWGLLKTRAPEEFVYLEKRVRRRPDERSTRLLSIVKGKKQQVIQ